MDTERLLKLADLLENDAANDKGVRFNLSLWARPSGEDEFKPRQKVKIDCGTTACAVGLACISGTFRDDGLRYSIKKFDGFCPIFEKAEGWNAVKDFFGLSFDDAYYLFGDSSYPSGKTQGAEGERYVARRIRDLTRGIRS
jgi:hypothetical protein